MSLLVAGGACALYLGAERYLVGEFGLPLDDGWIHLQLARRLAEGAGMSYQEGGGWTTASTAPLWTALLALAFLLPGSAIAWAKALGVAAFLATVTAADRLAAELGLATAPRILAAFVVATTHWLVWSALSGMEIALFTATSTWGMVLHLRERRDPARAPTAMAVLATAALLRPEGLLLLALALLDRLLGIGRTDPRPREGRLRETLLALAPALLVLLPTVLFYRFAGDSFLPTTFAVKGSLPGDPLPDGAYLRAVLGIFFASLPLFTLTAAGGVVRLLEHRREALLPAAWLLGLPLAYSLLAGGSGPAPLGNFGRYTFPLLPLVAVLGMLGLARLWEGLRSRHRALLATALLAPQLWILAHGPLRYAQTVANVQDSDVRAARWLAPRLDPGALLAVQDIGALKFFLPNPVLDLAGIVEPPILEALRGGDPQIYWERRVLAYLERRRPDYLVVFPASYPWLTGSATGFRRVHDFTIPDNVTMAGDRLAVYSTPWTRSPLTASDSGEISTGAPRAR